MAVAWGTAELLQQNNSRLARLDYRLLALCSMLPDIIDKPLAILVFTGANTSQLITHSLIFSVVLLVISLLWWRSALPYMLAFAGHVVLDRMWNHTESFWWPIYGWNVFWEYKPMNTAKEMVNVYLDIVTRYPQVWVIELIALLFFVWFGLRFKLYVWKRLKYFVWTGRIDRFLGVDKNKTTAHASVQPAPVSPSSEV